MATVEPTMIVAHRDGDVRFRNGQFTGNVQFDGTITTSGGGVLTPVVIASADGAIPIKTSIVQITKGTAAALTLAAPHCRTGRHDHHL